MNYYSRLLAIVGGVRRIVMFEYYVGLDIFQDVRKVVTLTKKELKTLKK